MKLGVHKATKSGATAKKHEAALWLSGEMGINRTLWHRACQVMGREYAAVALALVSTKPAEHFTGIVWSIGALEVGARRSGK